MLDEAFEEFTRKLKQGFAQESYNMDHVYVWEKFLYYSTNCKHFRKCMFGHLCLIDSAWSIEICDAVAKLLDLELVSYER